MERVQEVAKEIIQEGEAMILSDDMDSIISGTILQHYYNFDVVGALFYDDKFIFNDKYLCSNNVIGVDMTLFQTTKVRTISNHVENINGVNYNPSGISCNTHITDNYNDKSVFSTALLLWSVLDLPLPKTIEGRRILLAIDGTYQGYYKYNGRYRNQLVYYLRKYNLDGLIDTLENTTQQEMHNINRKYNLLDKLGSSNSKYGININCLNTLEYNNVCQILGLDPLNIDINYKYYMPIVNQYIHPNMITDYIEKGYPIISCVRVFRDTAIINYQKGQVLYDKNYNQHTINYMVG